MPARVVLGVAGGIAAFRAVEVLRRLRHAGCQVFPILTRNAARFVTPRSFAVLSGQRVSVSLWSDPATPGIDHTELARLADLLLVVPATANLLAKMAAGIADDALSTYALAHRRAVVLAPAMNTFMWQHPATQQALEVLRQRGAVVVEPVFGQLADGEVGIGKLAEVETIVGAALSALPPRGPWAGLRVLITAGPTREAVDAVRVLTNRSSGRMGVALAAAARELGAHVTLLAGPGVVAPPGIPARTFEDAESLAAALAEAAPQHHVVFHAAAVADFRPAQRFEGKLNRRQGDFSLALAPVPDLAAAVPRVAGKPYLVIFAAEAGRELALRAQAKLREKGAQAVVANPIDEPGLGMEGAANRALVFTQSGRAWEFPPQSKERLARELLLALLGDVLLTCP